MKQLISILLALTLLSGVSGGQSITTSGPVKLPLTAPAAGRATVRAATTANVTIATALNNGDTLDALTLATGDRVLVRSQTAAAENGVWVVGASPARATDFDAWAEFSSSMVYVSAGSAGTGKTYKCSAPTGGTLGTTALAYDDITTVLADALATARGTDYRVQFGNETPTYLSENPYVTISRAIYSPDTHGHGFWDATDFLVGNSRAYCSVDLLGAIGAGGVGAYDHYAGLQPRFRFNGATLATYYGVVTIPVINTGVVSEMQHYRINNATGSGTISGIQYGLIANSMDKSTFYNVPIAINGSGTEATQAKQASWHQPRISFGTGNVPGNNNQLEITPLAGNVSGRTALAITGGSTTGSGALNTVDIAQTWNTTGAPTALKVNITNTASGAAAKLMDLQISGTSRMNLDKNGNLFIGNTASVPGTPTGGGVLYVESGSLKYKGSSGTITTLGAP